MELKLVANSRRMERIWDSSGASNLIALLLIVMDIRKVCGKRLDCVRAEPRGSLNSYANCAKPRGQVLCGNVIATVVRP
jgi:hypothetical protein